MTIWSHQPMQNKNLKSIFLWPIVLSILSALALVTALLENGTIEQVSMLGLLTPIAVIIYFYCIKRD